MVNKAIALLLKDFIQDYEGLAILNKMFCDGVKNFGSCIESSGAPNLLDEFMANIPFQCQIGKWRRSLCCYSKVIVE